MRLHLASDHAGFELKAALLAWLEERGHDVVDHGAPSYDPQDDYPPYCLRAAEAVAADRGSLGIVIGGSGNGEQIAANKVRGIRCALAWSEETAELGRLHNNANVMGIGARMHTIDEAIRIAAVFVETEFTGEPRHQRRIDQLKAYEDTGELPPLPTDG
ncbi:MAG: ribose-5-phosphate isomerase [Actinomycetales bacterium]